jgi:hypothetical protein
MIAQSSREIADQMAKALRQEYRWHENSWWLFTLGKPARSLTEAEVKYAQGRGLIPTDPES